MSGLSQIESLELSSGEERREDSGVSTQKHRPYPEYVDSGVNWIGKIPSHWKVCRIAWLYNRTKRTGFNDAELLSVYRDFGVVLKSSRDDNFNKPSDDLSTYQLVELGDLVLNKMKCWQGSIAISGHKGIVSPAYFVYEPRPETYRTLLYPRFAHYLLRSEIYIAQYLKCSKGIRVNQWDLDPDEFRLTEVLLPPLTEQETVARFLDHEISMIDLLVEKQQKLIALLKEKRQAAISHAVTKGLNPHAEMKDSGVAWLGPVPVGWRVVRVKHITDYFTSGPRGWAGYYRDEGAIFLQSGNLTDNLSVDLDGAQRVVAPVGAEGRRTRLQADDVLICITGANTGRVARFESALDDVYINQHLCLLRPTRQSVLSTYLAFSLKANSGRSYFDIVQYGLKEGLSLENVKNAFIALPYSLEEQELIVGHITQAVQRIDILIGRGEKQIELLAERRRALISAAVTGQIDVRNWQVKAA